MKPKRQPMMRLLFLAGLLLLSGLTMLAADVQPVRAYTSYLTAAENQYPNIIGTKLDSCQLCHPSGGYSLNSYAQDYKNAGHNYAAIEQLDSDKDGFTNLAEINAIKWPGDPSDFPAAAATNTPTPTRTNTPTPSPTRPGPTSTWTATPTATQQVASATPTVTATPTSVALPGATPTPWPLPGLSNRFAFLGQVSDYPDSGNYVGDWRVSGRTVRVAATTWLEQPGLLGEHSQVWVLGYRAAGGAVDATYVRILTQGEDDDTGSPALTPSPTVTRTASKTPKPTETRRPTATFTPTRTPRAVASATPTRTPRPTEDDDDRRVN